MTDGPRSLSCSVPPGISRDGEDIMKAVGYGRIPGEWDRGSQQVVVSDCGLFFPAERWRTLIQAALTCAFRATWGKSLR
jgi:hypothetical protein